MSRLRALWWRVMGSLWFVPSLMVLGATVLAVILVEIDTVYQLEFAERWPRLFGAGAEGAREMLSAIASSMITVAGVVFSVTVVSLSLAASQYSPRVLRSFMADRPTQVVLGVFVGAFAYALVVLRTVRGGDETFVPPLAVLGAIAIAFAAIGFLVFFIHHLASSIEASSILSRVTKGTLAAVEDLFPEELGDAVDEAAVEPAATAAQVWTPVPACETGYIVSIDNAALLAFAREQRRVVRMEVAIGDFVVQGQTLASLEGEGTAARDAGMALNACYSFGRQRTTEQDAGFGLQQIVDVGLKALSPGINDQSTAILCIDRLSQLLVAVARRRIETPCRRDESGLRVIALGPSFAGMVTLAFSDLRESAAGKPTVLKRLLQSIERIAAATGNRHRRAVLAAEVERIADCARRGLPASGEREEVLARAAKLRSALGPAA
jgi:uncharacterized membrane protein